MDTFLNIVFTGLYFIWKLIRGFFRIIGKFIVDVVSHTYKRVVKHFSWLLYLLLAGIVVYIYQSFFK